MTLGHFINELLMLQGYLFLSIAFHFIGIVIFLFLGRYT